MKSGKWVLSRVSQITDNLILLKIVCTCMKCLILLTDRSTLETDLLVDSVAKFHYISEQPLAMVFHFLFLFPRNIVGSYQYGMAHHPTAVRQIWDFWGLFLTLFSYLDWDRTVYKNKQMFIFISRGCQGFWPIGSPNGPITSKDHVFTMGMCVYALIVHCDVTPLCNVTY